MYRMIHTRLMLALAIAAVVGTLGLTGSDAGTLTSEAAPAAAAQPTGAIPVLPTVTVRATAEIPTLPLVIVRADAPRRTESDAVFLVASTSSGQASTSAGSPVLGMPSLPHVRLDMPYYSFGKLLPRAIKE